ncbi:MAG: TetR family transcriptional regulator [Bacteroidota bacterium]
MSEGTEKSGRKRGRPVSREKIDQDRLLDIANKVFAEKGFEGAQLKEIAERAGISKSLMNYHYGNKEQLWKVSVKRLGEKLNEQLRETGRMLKDLTGVALMKAYNRQFIYFSAEHPEFYKIFIQEMYAGTERSFWMFDNILKPLYEFTEVFIKAAKADNDPIGKIPTANLSAILMGSANTIFMHAYQMQQVYGVDPFQPEEIERHADIINALVFGE